MRYWFDGYSDGEGLKLNTSNRELPDLKRECRKFRRAWHHVAAVHGVSGARRAGRLGYRRPMARKRRQRDAGGFEQAC
jgi:hypothetical protein